MLEEERECLGTPGQDAEHLLRDPDAEVLRHPRRDVMALVEELLHAIGRPPHMLASVDLDDELRHVGQIEEAAGRSGLRDQDAVIQVPASGAGPQSSFGGRSP